MTTKNATELHILIDKAEKIRSTLPMDAEDPAQLYTALLNLSAEDRKVLNTCEHDLDEIDELRDNLMNGNDEDILHHLVALNNDVVEMLKVYENYIAARKAIADAKPDAE